MTRRLTPMGLITFEVVLLGTLMTLIRYTHGFPNPDSIERVQHIMEMVCVVTFILFMLPVTDLVKNPGLSKLFKILLGLAIALTVGFEVMNLKGDRGSSVDIIMCVVVLTAANLASPYVLRVADRIHVKEIRKQPPRYTLPFDDALEYVYEGCTVESATGRTIYQGKDGHMVFDAPLEPSDADSKWRVLRIVSQEAEV